MIGYIENNVGMILVLIAVVCLVWLILLTFFVLRSLRFSRLLFGGMEKSDLKKILTDHMNRVGVVQTRLSDFEKALKLVEEDGRNHISKVDVVRYNPFEDTGGDQSFAMALLDSNNDGVVVSSLHGRDRTRMYAKPVKGGQSIDYDFSDEEKEAIKNAILIK